ncbi:uncharacterized protein LOC105221582 [Zeugodacus cucurbitae]|uniref:uncharacterized protein LOC105221582 n=1 Tax=Zeugodacus cucurbitae TaxID=28588 RepID=UPI0023D91EBC|nr:uncharacterized protein LOC105221582 [Zeugodacus cucurbitae]
MPESDVTKMKVADLKRELKLRGLATTGNKTELQDRLQTALLDGDISLEDSAITNEDALLDEDAVLTDEEESPIAADENELLKSPTSTPTASELPSPLNENKTSTDATNTATNPKKIILKRKVSLTNDDGKVSSATEGASITTSKENTEPPKEKVLKMSERNPITVSDLNPKESNGTDTSGKKVVQLTQMERLELRAKKFGLGSNSATAAAAPKPVNNTKVSNITIAPAVNDAKQMEMLKKRAERFGCVVSSKMAKIDAAEKLQKRKERFGAGRSATASSGVAVDSAKSDDIWAEKARARLERFKNTQSITTADKQAATTAEGSTENNEKSIETAPVVTPSASPTSVAGN